MSDNKHISTTAADKSIGFDYQFYYFLYLLLDLNPGEEIGYEVKDDIHITLQNGRLILLQTKHTVQTNADGNTINLTERDKDLWKTLHNWVNYIKNESKPKDFIKNTNFRLVSNKSTKSNPFFINLLELQNGITKLSDFKKYLDDLIKETEDTQITTYMKEVSNSKFLKEFLLRISTDIEESNLIKLVKDRILKKIYREEKVDEIYALLHSEIRDSNYLLVVNGKKVIYTFEDFKRNFGRCFTSGISVTLRRYESMTMPESPESQLFIKQLQDIADIQTGDLETIVLYTTHMLRLYNNLKDWQTKDGLLQRELSQFESNSITLWRNCFNAAYKGAIRLKNLNYDEEKVNNEMQIAADTLIAELRKLQLSISETELDPELSNGQFYYLLEQLKIGLVSEWEKKYKK